MTQIVRSLGEDEVQLADPTPRPTTAPSPTAEPRPGGDATEATEEPEPTVDEDAIADVTDEVGPYEAVPGEVYPNAKLLAAAVVQSLTTYGDGDAVVDVVTRSLVDPIPGFDVAGIASTVTPLIVPGATSVGRVVYPQLGGLAPAEAPQTCSVMVVTEQRITQGTLERVVTRCIDVRLVIAGGQWRLDRVDSIGGEELARPEDLPPEAAAVLDDDRIELPDSARWDIYAGIIDQRLLLAMLDMAERQPFAVTSLRNGHPANVFGTDRQSNHTAGRGVDVWRIGPEAVVSQRPDESTPAWQVNHDLFLAGEVPELGGPWAFDGFGGRSFTNEVHLDHLHVAFYSADRLGASPPADPLAEPPTGEEATSP